MAILSSSRVRFEPIRYLDNSSVSALSFTGVGSTFANPVRLLKVTNLMDVPILVSFNGIDAQDIVSANGFFLYDFGSNKAEQPGYLEMAVGDRVYAQAVTALPTVNGVYVTVMYASNN